MLEITSFSEQDTQSIGTKLAKKLHGTEIIALFGELGAGKTAFVKGLCAGLCVNDDITSPTFSLVNEYRGKYRVYHFDMYRVHTMEDLYSTGYFDFLDNGILVIEWSENIESILPEDAIRLRISYGKSENERILRFEGDFEEI